MHSHVQGAWSFLSAKSCDAIEFGALDLLSFPCRWCVTREPAVWLTKHGTVLRRLQLLCFCCSSLLLPAPSCPLTGSAHPLPGRASTTNAPMCFCPPVAQTEKRAARPQNANELRWPGRRRPLPFLPALRLAHISRPTSLCPAFAPLTLSSNPSDSLPLIHIPLAHGTSTHLSSPLSPSVPLSLSAFRNILSSSTILDQDPTISFLAPAGPCA